MHRAFIRVLWTALVAIVVLAPALAQAAGDVTVALTAQRVTQSNGRESFVPGDQASPGEVIEYRATYRNAGDRAVRQLAATLPIPQGMELLAASSAPRGALGSLDGRAFAPLPLKRKVRLADGREVVREVPSSEVRWLRWNLASLEAGAERTMRARVRVSPLAAVAAATR